MLEARTDASYVMLTVLGGLAEFERDLIRARTSEGRERAKARSVKLWSQAKTDRTPEARGDLAARLSTASRCETSPAAYNTISRLTARQASHTDDEATIR